MICPNCGIKNNASSCFCISCGTPLQVNEMPEFNSVNETKKKPKKDLKKIWILFAIGLLIGLGFEAYKVFFNEETKMTYEVSFDLDTPVLIKKNDKYGYVDTTGKVLIEPIYIEAHAFHGNYAEVTQKSSKETSHQMIDREGNVIMSSKYSFSSKYIEDYKVWIIHNKLYDENLKQLSIENPDVEYRGGGYFVFKNYNTSECGIMNAQGKVTYRYKLQDDEVYIDLTDSSDDVSLQEDYRVISIIGKNSTRYAIINCETGKIVYNFTNSQIHDKGSNLFMIENEKDSTASEIIYIQKDKIIYQTTNTHRSVNYLNTGYIAIEDDFDIYKDDYMTYFNLRTKKTTKEIPKSDRYEKDDVELLTGQYTYDCNSKKGIQKDDKVILNCEWNNINYFKFQLYQYLKSNGKDYVMGNTDKGIALIDLNTSRVVTTFNTSYIKQLSTSTFINYKDKSTDEIICYNLMTGQSEKFSSQSTIQMYVNYIKVKENDQTKYYDMNLKLFYTE